MVMSKVAQKVVVTQSCIDLSWSEMKWLLNALPLNPGDQLILLALLQHVHPSPFSLIAPLLTWNKGKEDVNKVFESSKKMREEELRRKREEYRQNGGVLKLQQHYKFHNKVTVSVEVAAGSSRKVAAVRAAKMMGATWIVLDREMKKDKQYFLDRLSCGISSMKSNNTIIELRGPINEHISYDEMIPSYSWEDLYPSKSPEGQGTTSCKEAESCCSSRPSPNSSQRLDSPSCLMEAKCPPLHVQEIGNTTSTKKATPERKAPGRALKYLKNEQNEACRTLESPILQQILNIGGRNAIYKNQMEEFENHSCSMCKNRRPKFGCHRDFTYAELGEATEGFSRRNYPLEGGFGFVFKGKLKDGLEVAVKQHKAASLQGEKEFKSEVHVLSQARHQNLVLLLGSCTEGSHRLLVYEYVCFGSLEEHLSADSPQPLNWEQRMKIAMGAAKGLEYLHKNNIIHRDMRPSNILLTHDFESLLGDFGLAKAQQDDTTTSSGVVGTLGYMAPEYAENGNLSSKTDVYSFGVVLLQLITGLKTTDEIPGGKSLVGWAKPLLETKNYPDLIDKRIVDTHDVHQLFWMVVVAEKCLKKDPDYRWTMQQVVHNLTCIKEGNTNFILDFA